MSLRFFKACVRDTLNGHLDPNMAYLSQYSTPEAIQYIRGRLLSKGVNFFKLLSVTPFDKRLHLVYYIAPGVE